MYGGIHFKSLTLDFKTNSINLENQNKTIAGGWINTMSNLQLICVYKKTQKISLLVRSLCSPITLYDWSAESPDRPGQSPFYIPSSTINLDHLSSEFWYNLLFISFTLWERETSFTVYINSILRRKLTWNQLSINFVL